MGPPRHSSSPRNALVALAYYLGDRPLSLDMSFWLFPLGRLVELPGLSPLGAALAFTLSLGLACWLAILSFRRASYTDHGHRLAALTIIPVLQVPAAALIAVLPRRAEPSLEPEGLRKTAHKIQGMLTGVALIVLAVLVSAVSFGAYGWGLFVMTPLTVGMTTAYIANRDEDIGSGPTMGLVLSAATLGTLALVMFALEGLICILMASPLGALAAIAGGAMGRAIALAGHRRGRPFLAVALLPAAFALEGAMPPSLAIATNETIEISAPAGQVWRALISEDPIASPPGLVARAGLAYPLRGRILGTGPGAERLGFFSTGVAHERITGWEPGRRLSFKVISQPAAMEEMSPYRRVHAPHLHGYFETAGTRFEIDPLPHGRTRLTIHASHVLRIDPVLYWEPIARWALRENTRRVLVDLKDKAEGASPARPAA